MSVSAEAYHNYDGMPQALLALWHWNTPRQATCKYSESSSSYRQSVQQTGESPFGFPQILELMREYHMRRRQKCAGSECGKIELEATLHENGWDDYYGRKRVTR